MTYIPHQSLMAPSYSTIESDPEEIIPYEPFSNSIILSHTSMDVEALVTFATPALSLAT